MRVKVEISLDIDGEAWEAEYGEAPTRADVREYVRQFVHVQLADVIGIGGLAR